MADDKQELGELVGKGGLAGTDLSGAEGASITSGQAGSGIPITTYGGDTGTDAPGVSNKVANDNIEQVTTDTQQDDEKGNI
jgi:hypothetical protein